MRKNILIIGDSNTHGFVSNPANSGNGTCRYSEDDRYPDILQKRLGDEYRIISEGLTGRTTVFSDPIKEGMDCITILAPLCMSHEPLSLLVFMLGTNDTKDRFSADARIITLGMERLVRKALTLPCYVDEPKIMIVSPPPIGGLRGSDEELNKLLSIGRITASAYKSALLPTLYRELADRLGIFFAEAEGCEMIPDDTSHLSKAGHAHLAEILSEKICSLQLSVF